MQRLLAILAAFSAVSLTLETPQVQFEKEDQEVVRYPCPPSEEPSRSSDPLQDLAPGLVFDPLAPGGARPAGQEDITPVPVDPRTVLIFPAPLPETEGTDSDETHPDCRR